MIIRRDGDDYLFITQPDHAALAERVMRHCVELQRHPRAKSILLAIGEHDNGWAEPDATPAVDRETGEPLDFINVPASVRQGVWPRGVGRLAPDLWAAALVSHHAVAVYERYRGEREWAEFFPRMEAMRDSLVTSSRGTLKDLLADYRFVRLGDLLSLMFCTGWEEPQHFHRWTVSRSGDRVGILPSPFESRDVEMTVQAKRIPVARFANEEELHAALASATLTTLQGTVGRPAKLDEAGVREDIEQAKKAIGRYQGERQVAEAAFEQFTASFAKGTPAPSPPRAASVPQPTDAPLPEPTVVATTTGPQKDSSLAVPLFVALVLIALAGVGYFVWSNMPPAEGPVVIATPPPVVETPAPVEQQPAAPPATAPAADPAPAAAAPSTFESVVTTTSAVWVRVVADGQTVVARELPADTRVPFTARESIVIRTGNAGAVRLTMGGVDQGAIGRPGQTVTRRFDVPR